MFQFSLNLACKYFENESFDNHGCEMKRAVEGPHVEDLKHLKCELESESLHASATLQEDKLRHMLG